MAGKFDKALEANTLPVKLGDVSLQYEVSLWVGRARKASRGPLATSALVVGSGFGVATLAAIVSSADHATLLGFLAPTIAAFAAAAWLEQRERRQRAFAVDFVEHVLRLDFSTPITGMPRTLRVAFDQVKDLAFTDQGDGNVALTVDFEAGNALFREVLIAHVPATQRAQAERVRRMLRAAVGLEKPPPEPGAPAEPPPPIDSFG